MSHNKTPEPTGQAQAPTPVFRSGTVARMAGMPVSTLRVWEQRYQAVGPGKAPSGHRLYDAAEVERVVMLRKLTAQGYAIGSLAGLSSEQLSQIARRQASTDATADAQPTDRAQADATQHTPAAGGRSPLRIAVVGQAMALRLRRAAVLGACVRPPRVVAVFDSLTDAVAHGSGRQPVDLLLWHTTGLQDSDEPALTAAKQVCGAQRVAAVYRFAGASARERLVASGITVVREPADDPTLSAWLAGVEAALLGQAGPPAAAALDWPLDAWGLSHPAPPARRFDDATLTEFAGLSSGVACNCPGHLAELLMQIASFEAYSRDCIDRSPADAELHAHLQRTAGVARVLFETALERVALAEGWALP